MTAKNRGQASKIHDVYPTPLNLVRAAFDFFAEHHGPFLASVRNVLEPGAYSGAFLWGASLYCPNTIGAPVGVELAPPEKRLVPYKLVKKDFRKWETSQRFDLIATNPPFTWANAFMRKSVSLLSDTGKCLFLMRIGVLAGVERFAMWRDEVNLREVWVCVRRPGFKGVGQGTDASEYAFFMFDGDTKHPSTEVKVRWLWW